MHMVARLDEAERAAEAGADVIVAQGSEGGGHVGEIGDDRDRPPGRESRGSAAGRSPPAGFGDGAGLASALALGATAYCSARVPRHA